MSQQHAGRATSSFFAKYLFENGSATLPMAVPCDILENILQVPLSGPGIKVLGMTKEEQT
jgi:hypothetical protein